MISVLVTAELGDERAVLGRKNGKGGTTFILLLPLFFVECRVIRLLSSHLLVFLQFGTTTGTEE